MNYLLEQGRSNKGILMMVKICLLLALFVFLQMAFSAQVMATGVFFQQIPDGYEKNCTLCHTQPPILNDFGNEFKARGFEFPASENQPGEDGLEGQPKEDADVALFLPVNSIRGEKIELQARVTVNGVPAAGKQVEFFEKVLFFVEDNMKLGQAKTDQNGIAQISYWPRGDQEEVVVVASVLGDSQINPAETNGAFGLVLEGPLVQPREGLYVPFIGAWLLAVVVIAVWATFIYVIVGALGLRKLGASSVDADEYMTEQQHSYR